MSDDENGKPDLPNTVPLFPLPNVVALPGVALHLHIFEPRYRELIGDLDTANPFLALALIERGHDPAGNPPVVPIVCAGRLTHLQPMDDGRFFLIFASMGRARLLGEDQESHAYRLGEIDWLDPEPADGPAQLHLRFEVQRSFEIFAQDSEVLQDRFQKLRGLDIPLGRLVDMLASCMPLDLDLQRRVLEELDPAKRAGLLLTILRAVSGAREHFPVH